MTVASSGATLPATTARLIWTELNRQRWRTRFLHGTAPRPLLPNVWDALSARLFVAAGFDALATTSGGVAWALGYPDGEFAPWAEVVAATARIVRSAQVPVTADIEAGYGATPAEVGAHVAEIIQAGVIGINLEDGLHGPIRSIEDAAARLRAAREAASKEGVPIVLNARCDVFQLQHGEESTRFASTVARCKTYLAAGADAFTPLAYAIRRRLPHSSRRSADLSTSPVDPAC